MVDLMHCQGPPTAKPFRGPGRQAEKGREMKTGRSSGAARIAGFAAAVVASSASLYGGHSARSEDAGGRQTEIKVAYTIVSTVEAPHEGTFRAAWTRTLVLSGSNEIDEVLTYNGAVVGRAKRTLGSSYKGPANANGLTVSNSIRVSEGSIVIPNEYESYTDVTTIKTNGKTSCSATMVFRLKPGHLRFETAEPVSHAAVVMSDLHAEDVTCTIRTF